MQPSTQKKIHFMVVWTVLASKIELYFRDELSEAELVALLRDAKKRVTEIRQQ